MSKTPCCQKSHDVLQNKMNNLKILEYHTFATVRASLHFKLALFFVMLHLARTAQERTAILHVRALQWRVLTRSNMLLKTTLQNQFDLFFLLL